MLDRMIEYPLGKFIHLFYTVIPVLLSIYCNSGTISIYFRHTRLNIRIHSNFKGDQVSPPRHFFVIEFW